jgi:hypothetical protein
MSKKYRIFYVDKMHLEDCDKSLDLGEGKPCRVVYYPHRDDEHRLIQVTESAYVRELEAKLESEIALRAEGWAKFTECREYKSKRIKELIKLRDEKDRVIELYKTTLEKIADPRKRDHSEPDEYTSHGCVIHMAEQALEQAEKLKINQTLY